MTIDVAVSSQTWLDRIVTAAGRRLLPRAIKGNLDITLPSGRELSIGSSATGIAADIQLKNYYPLWSSMRRASIGFAESYMSGHWESSDPGKIIRFYLQNRHPFNRSAKPLFFKSVSDKFWHRRRANNRNKARQNIAAHYDLGNEFFRLWLDETMTYSSAWFAGGAHSLEAAQRAKYDRIIEALELAPGHHVHEIGCGWGGFAVEAGKRGARVRGITLSREQLSYAQDRVMRAGLSEACTFHLEDYRDTTGTFDRIASIEMIEAVGEAHWPHYFQSVRERLKSGGIAVIQAITIADRQFARYRGNVDFIQRYIFPGGMLPSERAIAEAAARAGLSFERVESFGTCYAKTLVHWRERFEAAWPSIAALGFDERFRRMWRLYLSYCEAGFLEGAINAGIYRLRRNQMR
jgi:cyclopropane-fatty-acyl-phospholipid synthase